MNRLTSERGFTLVEMLVTLTISLAAFGGVLGALHTMLNQSSQARRISEAQDQARKAVDGIAVALRNAMAAPGLAPTAVERDAPNDLIFQAVDPTAAAGTANVVGAMRLRYCLDASNPSRGILRRQAQRWTTASAPAVPTATACDAALNGWADNRIVVTDLVNTARSQPVWTYGPTGYGAIANIRAIETNLIVDLNPADTIGERKLTGGVALRNANRPPNAVFTLSQAGGFVVANGSASTDPDGDSLEYQWWLDGGPVPGATAAKWQTGLASGTTHTIELVVTDPSGLSTRSSPPRTVIVQ